MNEQSFATKVVRPGWDGSTVTGPPNTFWTCLAVTYWHGFSRSNLASNRRGAAAATDTPATVTAAMITTSARKPHLTAGSIPGHLSDETSRAGGRATRARAPVIDAAPGRRPSIGVATLGPGPVRPGRAQRERKPPRGGTRRSPREPRRGRR